MAEDDEPERTESHWNGEESDVVDAAFDALADDHRRLALYYLRDRGSVDLDELATVISGWRQTRAPGTGRVTPDDRNRVRVALHHAHLPRLADAGFVSYDADARRVTLDRLPDVLDSMLDRSLADDRRGVEPFDAGPGSNADDRAQDGTDDDDREPGDEDPESRGDGT